MRAASVLLALTLVGCRLTRTDLSAPCAWRELDSPPVAVVTDGGLLPIVAADSSTARQAAFFLASVVEETCGRRPDVLVELKGQSARQAKGLFVGDVVANRDWSCPLSDVSEEAFRVVAEDGCVRFLGRADYAVFDWCERELGFRYYCVDGRCAERRKTVLARAVDYSDRPAFDCRIVGAQTSPWVRFAKTGSSHRGGVNAHAPSRWYANEILKAEAPEIFETGETPMLCYGNPKTLAHYRRRIDRQIAGLEDSGGIVDTNRKVVTVCQWDAPVACRCADCRPLYEGTSASAIVWGRFLPQLSEWLADRHPDYMVSFLPYLNTCDLPQDWIVRRTRRGPRGTRLGVRRDVRSPLPPGVTEAEPCTMTGLALLKNETCRRREERRLRDWCRATGRKVLNWNYGCWPRDWTTAPYVFGRTIQRHCAAMREFSCGTFVCGGSDDPRLALSMYVWRRCLWNPEVDVEAVYDEFARRMFGRAARPMRDFIAMQEDGWNRQWQDDGCSAHNVFNVSYPRADVERMAELLREAYGLAQAAGELREQNRILRYVRGWGRFQAESAAFAGRKARKVVRPGEACAMSVAMSVARPKPRWPTTVTTSSDGETLHFRVRCAEPAVAKLDFSHLVKDFVWGNDCVAFAFDNGDDPPWLATVYLTGEIEGRAPDGFAVAISRDASSWTVEADLRLTERQRQEGKVLGNVCRWRVGDGRIRPSDRTETGRLEQSRLDTCYTRPNDDPAAFVEFRL